MISREAWEAWLDQPETRAFREILRMKKEELKEQWASGAFTDVHEYGAAILNAKAIGQVEILTRLEELDYEAIEGDLGER